MTFKERIRSKLDSALTTDFDIIAKEIISEGISDGELMEILPDIVKEVGKTRVAAPFFQKPVNPVAPTVANTPTLLPKVVPVPAYTGSEKVKAYQSTRLDELYPVGSGKYKKLSEMNREDIRYNVRMLEGRIKATQGRIKGWNTILDQMLSYKVNVVQDLPDDVKDRI